MDTRTILEKGEIAGLSEEGQWFVFHGVGERRVSSLLEGDKDEEERLVG